MQSSDIQKQTLLNGYNAVQEGLVLNCLPCDVANGGFMTVLVNMSSRSQNFRLRNYNHLPDETRKS